VFGGKLAAVAQQYGMPTNALIRPDQYYTWARRCAYKVYGTVLKACYNLNKGACFNYEKSLTDIWNLPKLMGGFRISPNMSPVTSIAVSGLRKRQRTSIFESCVKLLLRVRKAA